jgi:predicted LPLAT superfamily acyltransferase
VLPGFFLRAPDGSYFNVWGEPLSPDPGVSPDEDARRMIGRVAADLELVVRKYPTQWFNFYRFWNEPDRSEDPLASAASRAASRG